MKFIPVETATTGIWMIGFDNLDWAEYKNEHGCSYNVLGSRLLQMSYPDYLKYLRSRGAELRGKSGIIYPVFKDKNICERFCTQLNSEWDRIRGYVE